MVSVVGVASKASRAQLCLRLQKTGKRSEIFLATKFGITGDPKRPVNGDPENVRVCIDKSLSRLGGTGL
jgi:aryl-alcohol dehydrogenase-like predicted oxidoreductase